MTNEIREKVDEYVALTKQVAEIKAKTDDLKGYFEKLATDDLKDTKTKTIEYWGSQNAKVIVGNSETVKPVSMTMVKKVFGNVFGDFVKEEIDYKMTAPCKRLMAMVFMGNYTEGKIDELISGLSEDSKIKATLKKKLKGRFDKDKAILMSIAGLPEKEASDWAYIAAEVLNWEWLLQILQAAQWNGTTEQAIGFIKSAIIVDEGIKVTIETED